MPKAIRNTLIFGGAGFLAGEIRRTLKSPEHIVVPVVKNEAQSVALPGSVVADVLKPEELMTLAKQITLFDHIVYAVGHCPPGGVNHLNDTPLHRLWPDVFQQDLDRLYLGLSNVIRIMLDGFDRNGSIVVLGSTITRLTDEDCLPDLYGGQYAAAQAAQAESVRWWRRDPRVRKMGIAIHRLAIGAVDSPFFERSDRDPNTLINPDMVSRTVISLLGEDSRHQDIELTVGGLKTSATPLL